jgi:sialate O-acetylesterase
MKNLIRIALLALLFTSTANLMAAVKLPAIISSNMIIQQDRKVAIWGWADKGETVSLAIDNQNYSTKADQNGHWKISLQKLKAGAKVEMTVNGTSGNSITVKNILVGEVWLCSGQSNMQWTLYPHHTVLNNEQELANANYDEVRMYTVDKVGKPEPTEDTQGEWLVMNRKNLLVGGEQGTSALAYFFGRDLYKKLNVPIGLINSSVGGTTAEKWTKNEVLESKSELKSLVGKKGASTLYNGMIAPLKSYTIRGVIWYQGESNVDRAYQYRTLFPAMIQNWRSDWNEKNLPFGFVQLAPCRYKGQNPEFYVELCEAQLKTLQRVKNTGMVVTNDIGDVNNIHPQNKQEVGRRLVLWAMNKVYKDKKTVYSGPLYKSMKVNGDKISLSFTHYEGGLIARDEKPLNEFTIAGADQKFVAAKAEISGNTIVVSSDQVKNPVAVRYAWHDDALPNLGNKEGLPASSFRTDSWKGVTQK